MNTITLGWLLIVVNKIIYFAHASWLSGNLCWSMPCMNGGSCFGSAFTYLCICPVNYSGPVCEKRLGICQENPCGHRGVCIEKTLTTFECRCYFDYMGPTCEEHLPRNLPSIWSSLLPAHTRVLFDMLEEAYRVRAKDRSLSSSDDHHIDFVGLLNTNESISTTSPMLTTEIEPIEATSVVYENDFTTSEHVIHHAHAIQLDKIFPDLTTKQSTLGVSAEDFAEQPFSYDNPTTFISYTDIDMTTTTMIVENMTTINIDTNFSNATENDDFINSTEETFTIVTSTSAEPLDSNDTFVDITTDGSMEEITNETDSILMTSTELMDVTTSEIDMTINDYDTASYSSEPMTSSIIDTTTTSPIAQRQLLYKLCRQILSQILPNESAEVAATDTAETLSLASDSLPANNKTADALLSWLSKYISSTRSATTSSSSSVPTLIVSDGRAASASLQRIDMDDALQELNSD